MIAKDAGIDAHPLIVGRARFSDLRVGEDAVGAIEPSIRTPNEIVERFVSILPAPAIEHDLWLTDCDILMVVLAWEEQQVWRSTDPYAAVTDGDA